MASLISTLASSSSSPRGLLRALTGAGSVAIHCVVLSVLLASSLLHVEPLAEPSIPSPPMTFERHIEVEMVGPASSSAVPPPPGGGGAPEQALVTERQAQAEEALPLVQPREQPESNPPSAPESGAVGSGGSGDGPPGGMPDGVDGGIPGFGGGGSGTGGMGALSGLPSDSPVLLGSDVTPPERILYVQPVYPEIARKSRAAGVVIMEIVVGRSGDVTEVKVLKSHPLFDAAAVEAVKRWKYKPAMLGEKPVRVYMTIRVEFNLK